MQTRRITKEDFQEIVRVIDRWWGGPTNALAHPVFFYELGAHARVVENDGQMVGFLFGLISSDLPKTGYVHLVGIHPEHRRQGVGGVLYRAFEEEARARGCTRMKAIANPGNQASHAFHLSLGWNAHLVDDYAGPSRPREVFLKDL